MKRKYSWNRLAHLLVSLAFVSGLVLPTTAFADDKGKGNGNNGASAGASAQAQAGNNKPAGNPPNNATNQTNADNGKPGQNAGASAQAQASNNSNSNNDNDDRAKAEAKAKADADAKAKADADAKAEANARAERERQDRERQDRERQDRERRDAEIRAQADANRNAGGNANVKGAARCAPSNPDGMTNDFSTSDAADGLDKDKPADPAGTGGVKNVATEQDCNNGSGNDDDCEDDNNGRGVPGHCKTRVNSPPEPKDDFTHLRGCFMVDGRPTEVNEPRMTDAEAAEFRRTHQELTPDQCAGVRGTDREPDKVWDLPHDRLCLKSIRSDLDRSERLAERPQLP